MMMRGAGASSDGDAAEDAAWATTTTTTTKRTTPSSILERESRERVGSESVLANFATYRDSRHNNVVKKIANRKRWSRPAHRS